MSLNEMTVENMNEKYNFLKGELWKHRKLAVSYFFGFSISLALGITWVVTKPDGLVPALIIFTVLLIPSGICTFFYGWHWYRLSQSVAWYRGAIESKDREGWVTVPVIILGGFCNWSVRGGVLGLLRHLTNQLLQVWKRHECTDQVKVLRLSHVASFPYWRLRLVSCGSNPGFTTSQDQSRAYQDEPGRTNTKDIRKRAEEV